MAGRTLASSQGCEHLGGGTGGAGLSFLREPVLPRVRVPVYSLLGWGRRWLGDMSTPASLAVCKETPTL